MFQVIVFQPVVGSLISLKLKEFTERNIFHHRKLIKQVQIQKLKFLNDAVPAVYAKGNSILQ